MASASSTHVMYHCVSDGVFRDFRGRCEMSCSRSLGEGVFNYLAVYLRSEHFYEDLRRPKRIWTYHEPRKSENY
jgi:hypothetical protein